MENSRDAIRDFFLPNRLHLAVAESLTAGLLQSKIAALNGASQYFNGGITTYIIAMKVQLLGVDRAKAEATHAVDPHIAEAMARGICQLMDASIGLSTTGFAEADANLQVTRPYAYIGLFAKLGDAEFCISKKIEGSGLDKKQMLELVAESAMQLLAETIETTLLPAVEHKTRFAN